MFHKNVFCKYMRYSQKLLKEFPRAEDPSTLLYDPPRVAHMQLTWKEVELPSSVGSISLKQMSKKHPRMSVLPQIPTHLLSSDR